MEGLDLDLAMLAVARERAPDVPLHEVDMAMFDLGRRFDVVACLGSAILAVRTTERLDATIATFRQHLEPGGVALVEPFIPPARWEVGRVSAVSVDEPGRKITRMHVADLTMMVFHYLVGTRAGVDHFTEHHEFGLFRHEHYLTAFERAGLTVVFDQQGISGRGLYIATRPIVDAPPAGRSPH